MRCDFGGDPIRPVVADDTDDIAAFQPKLDQAQGKVVDAGLIIAPGENFPEPEIFLAQRDLAAEFGRVEAQQFRIGIGLFDPARIIHHAALSAATNFSWGSTSTSSSSPR